MKIKKTLLFLAICAFSGLLHPAVGSSDVVRFVNRGKIVVAAKGNSGKSSLYIPHAVWMRDSSSIRQEGITFIGGSFYQDARTNVFYKSDEGFSGEGRVVFFRNNGADGAGASRYITTKLTDIDAFDRGSYFVAFPEIEIRTEDTVIVPARMGIDARKLIRDTDFHGGGLGKLWLKSKSVDGHSYDASLRITSPADAASDQLIPAGSVVIERDLKPYRIDKGTGNGSLFAFASPFKHQRSGYFAANWLRRMLEDPGSGHVQYVYGNRRDANDVILPEQYIVDPVEAFEAGKAYLVKLRARGFDYSQLLNSGGLPISSGGDVSDYDDSTFVFYGAPYRMPVVDEQAFADSVLFKRSIDLNGNDFSTYINWVIGNSYTSPIDVKALVDLMGKSSLFFEPRIYVFPAGSSNYQVYNCQDDDPGGMNVISLDEIPSMSYFMVRLDNQKAQKGTFVLRRNEILTHGKASHTTLRRGTAKGGFDNEILFRVSLLKNPNIYDLAGIGLRSGGNPDTDAKDILKPGSGGTGDGGGNGSELFSLYSVSGDGKNLLTNIVPETADTVPLCFSPGSYRDSFKLEISRMESLRTEGLWLEDTQEGAVTDLLQTGGSYSFKASPEDRPERFIVRFRPSNETDLRALEARETLRCYCSEGRVTVQGLREEDAGARLLIYDTQGQLLRREVVTQTPEMSLAAPRSEGVYIFRLEGKRVVNLKFRQ